MMGSRVRVTQAAPDFPFIQKDHETPVTMTVSEPIAGIDFFRQASPAMMRQAERTWPSGARFSVTAIAVCVSIGRALRGRYGRSHHLIDQNKVHM